MTEEKASAPSLAAIRGAAKKRPSSGARPHSHKRTTTSGETSSSGDETSAPTATETTVSASAAATTEPAAAAAPITSEEAAAAAVRAIRPVSASPNRDWTVTPMSSGGDPTSRPQTAATAGASPNMTARTAAQQSPHGQPSPVSPHTPTTATQQPKQQQQQLTSQGPTEENEADTENWKIYGLYSRHEFRACAALIDQQLTRHPKCEYALYVRALIRRQQGDIQESLRLFEQCYVLSPSVNNVKQIARSYYLLGKHKSAITAYEKVEKVDNADWETWHNKGLCYMYLKNYPQAADCLRKANAISKHDATYAQLSKLYVLQDNHKAAIEVLIEGLEFSPENPDLLTSLGLLYLRTGENYRAFDYFGNALAQDPTNPKTILAAGSIIQDHSEVEVALIKYRIAAVHTPHSAQLWNNIGMCFFSKQKFVAAIASLKKALYHAPFEWIISYNLGLVHLHTGQYASAFHFFSAAINLKPDFPITYMHLAITLSRLGDYKNACTAYEKAIELYSDPIVRLNYAILHYTHGEHDLARRQFAEFDKMYTSLDEDTRAADPAMTEQRAHLATVLFPASVAATFIVPTQQQLTQKMPAPRSVTQSPHTSVIVPPQIAADEHKARVAAAAAAGTASAGESSRKTRTATKKSTSPQSSSPPTAKR